MSTFDFVNATPTRLLPLEASHEENQVEHELKALFLQLWDEHLAASAFDANVQGMAHLGSFDLVRRSVNRDGLSLIPGSTTEEAATRYLYRAWKSRNHQGRGLHFIRTYLQMLFPGVSKVEQLWMPLEGAYPQDAYSIIPEDEFIFPLISDDNGLRLDGAWAVGGVINTSEQGKEGSWSYDTSNLWLTSRVRITLDFSADAGSVSNLLQILRNVLPARLVPVFHYQIEIQAPIPVISEAMVDVEVHRPSAFAFPTMLLVTDEQDMLWELGSDGEPDKAFAIQSNRADHFDDIDEGPPEFLLAYPNMRVLTDRPGMMQWTLARDGAITDASPKVTSNRADIIDDE